MSRRSLAAALLALGATASGSAAQHPLAGLPLSDPAYVQLDGLVRQGCAAAHVSPYRPYLVKDIHSALRLASGERRCAGHLLTALTTRFLRDTIVPGDSSRQGAGFAVGAAVSLGAAAHRNGEFRPLWKDVRDTDAGDPSAIGVARVRLSWDGGPRILVVSEAFGKTSTRNDPQNREQAFRRTSGAVGFEDAYITGQPGKLVLSVGRAREAWLGDGGESLMLSASGPAFDRVLLSIPVRHFEFRGLLSSINDVQLDRTLDTLPAGVVRQRWHRIIVAHALTYHPSPKFELSLGETALVQRQGGAIDLGYMNPFMLYQTTQHDTSQAGGGDANLTWFFGSRATVGPATLSGELLIDDFQIDSQDRQVYPDQLGWNVRGSIALPAAIPSSIGVQYRRVDSYTYLGRAYSKVYHNFDQPLGSELGPDADMARAFGELWPSGRLRLSSGIARWRHGALRIDDRPAQDRRGRAGDPFPAVRPGRPEVQRSWLADLSVEWLDAVIPVTLRAEVARIENVNNQPTPPTNFGRLQVSGTFRFRYP